MRRLVFLGVDVSAVIYGRHRAALAWPVSSVELVQPRKALMVSFEPECVTQCAGEHQTLQPWPVQSHREGGTD